MKLTLALLVITAFGLSLDVSSQSRKEREALGISEKIEYKIDYENSNGKEYIELIERFDKRGELIEEIEYDKTGSIKKHMQYVYQDSLMLKEITLDGKGKIEKTTEYIYDKKGLEIERKYYDSKGRIVKARKYTYKRE